MRLWNKKESVAGGLYYIYSDDKGREYTVRGHDLGWDSFISRVRREMTVNGVEVPSNLADYVEDQICSRQPEGKCYYENKTGDQISKYIHKFAGGLDAAASAIGIKTEIEKKARSCRTCGGRRVSLNT